MPFANEFHEFDARFFKKFLDNFETLYPVFAEKGFSRNSALMCYSLVMLLSDPVEGEHEKWRPDQDEDDNEC